MVITDIRCDNLAPQDLGICGEFTITLDNAICIHKIYVVNGEKGYFITFPNTGEMKMYKKSKRFFDIVHPTNQNTRQMIENEVLQFYKNQIGNLSN